MFQPEQLWAYNSVVVASFTSLDPWYVTGFAEGEGSFTFSRSGPRLAMYFSVKLTRADRSILEGLQTFFDGAGIIYDVGPRAPGDRSGFTKSASYYRVCRKAELGRVVAHFDAYPLKGSKAAAYRIWREMVSLKSRSPRPQQDRLEDLAKRLSAASPRNGPWSGEGLQGSGTGRRGPRQRAVLGASSDSPDLSVHSNDLSPGARDIRQPFDTER